MVPVASMDRPVNRTSMQRAAMQSPSSIRTSAAVLFCLLALATHARAQVAHLGEEDPRTEEPLPSQSLPFVLEGLVLEPDGAPAVGAVVVTSAGGQAVTDADGAYRLEV